MHTPLQLQMWRNDRAYSWSQHSSFAYSPQEWYSRYILGNATPANPAMTFGKKFADSVEWGTPMAPVDVLSHVEYKLEAALDKLPLIGYVDSYAPHTHLREYKTGKSPWTQKKVDDHGQITMYALMLHLIHSVRPEDLDIALQWIPTTEQPDFTYGFALNKEGHSTIHTFTTKRTTLDILKFANEIKETRKAMEEFIESRKTDTYGGKSIHKKTIAKLDT